MDLYHTFDFRNQGFVTVTMEKYIQDIRNLYKVIGTVKDPTTADLFNVDDTSPILDSQRSKEFHSRVMKLMWIAKRTTFSSFLFKYASKECIRTRLEKVKSCPDIYE